MRILRAAALGLAAASGLFSILIALNRVPLGLHLTRFREPAWVLYGCLALWVAGRPSSRTWVRERWPVAVRWAARPESFRWTSGLMLALFVLSTLTQHWSFRTFSHDFSMIDEALWYSHHGRFLYSPVLGRSFLSEHFSPILALLVPLHALFPTPYLLLVIQPLALWASGLALRAVLRQEGADPAAAHLVTLAYLNSALMVSTLDYVFHMECFLPLAVFAMFLCYRRGQWLGYAATGLLALSIKEDVGLYLAGLGLWEALAERRRGVGLVTLAVGLAWTWAAVTIAIPRAAPGSEGYVFAARWAHWGEGPLAIAWGLASRPIELARDLCAGPYLGTFAACLFIPFAVGGSALLVLAPWVVNATSGLPAQQQLLLYYGIPLLTFAALASALGLRRVTPWLDAHRGWKVAAAVLVLTLNVSHLSFPRIPVGRQRVEHEIARLPAGASVQVMPSLYPLLPYGGAHRVFWRGDSLAARFVLLATEGSTWPFSAAEVLRLSGEAEASGTYRERARMAGFLALERATPVVTPAVTPPQAQPPRGR